MQYVKGGFSFRLKSKTDVWEKSFDEHRVKDRLDYETHRVYIEQNPVVERLCLTADAFPHSSATDSAWLKPAPIHLQSPGLKPL